MRYRYLFILIMFAYGLCEAPLAMAAFRAKASQQNVEQKAKVHESVFRSDPTQAHPKRKAIYGITSFAAAVVADFMVDAVTASSLGAIAAISVSITAVVLGAIGMNRKYKLRGLAIAGFILGFGFSLMYFLIGGVTFGW